jgi:hypothetical protein
VKAIVTGKDELNHYQGKSIRDIPALVAIPATAERGISGVQTATGSGQQAIVIEQKVSTERCCAASNT